MKRSSHAVIVLSLTMFLGLVLAALEAHAWDPVPVSQDPLVRMPGTQPDQGVDLPDSDQCFNCHADYDPLAEPGRNWQGGMMAQAMRDPLFWASMVVAAQDAVWAVGTPNGTDICLRCHAPRGWLAGRSDPTNGSLMAGGDFDGVQCTFCHYAFDPFFETTADGTREGSDWTGYWDESNDSDTPSAAAALATYLADEDLAAAITLFNGDPFFTNNLPPVGYFESGGGQYFVSTESERRASFADADANHAMLYSRYHKSKFFCSACHDVSNPILANLGADPALPLPSETAAAATYFHVERTFSEFMLSAYGAPGGAPGIGPFAPGLFDTSRPGDVIASCQDCHMPDVPGKGADKNSAILRPSESIEHPQSGVPSHDLTGGNLWVPAILASTVPGSPNYDPVNDALLNQGPAELTLDLDAGLGLDPATLLAARDRAAVSLGRAASVEALNYSPATGALSFRVQNQTGHKLLSGYPEGRRLFVNIRAYAGESLLWEVNPYDDGAGTLRGLPPDYSPNSPPLAAHEFYVDPLVYEMHPGDSLAGEEKTFHFVLATSRFKDNRIPPQGFRIAEAPDRLVEPAWGGAPDPDYFTAEEYAGGYDAVVLTDYGVTLPGADRLEIALYYQTTSREYVEFLRDEINGTGNLTLPSPTPSGEPEAYIVQSDPFFAQLRPWGDTIWQLWEHNQGLPGAAPVEMTAASWRLVDDTDYGLTYDGWHGGQDAGALGGGYRAASAAGQWLAHRTPALTSIALHVCVGPDQGIAYPLIDGVFRGILDLYAATPACNVPVTYAGLPAAPHVVVFAASGTKNPASSGTEVRLDGLAVGGDLVDDDDAGVIYRSWSGLVTGGAYAGSARLTTRANATASFAFDGPSFSWLTAYCPLCGIAEISVDGQVVATVDTYRPTWALQQAALVDDLGPGPHVATIRNTGTANPASTGTLIVIDAIGMP